MIDNPSFIRKNLVPLLSSVCVLLLIGNYVFFQIPENKKRLDDDYYKVLTHLRENIEMVNGNLTKSVLADTHIDSTGFCKKNELPVRIRLMRDYQRFTILDPKKKDTAKTYRDYDYESVYKKVLHCETLESIAIADPASKSVYYHTGKREPNAEMIFKRNALSDYFYIKDTAFSDLRYYIYQFKPAGFENKMAVIIAVKTEQYEADARSFDLSKTMFVLLLLLLFALLLPLLKSVTATRYENLGVVDVVLSTSAIGTMSVIVIIIIMSYGMYYYFNKADEHRIKEAGKNLKSGFESELNAVGHAFEALDDSIRNEKVNLGNLLREDFIKKNPQWNTSFIKRIFRFFRLNERGREVQNVMYRDTTLLTYSYNDFSDRNYFKYQQTHKGEGDFYYDPLISWKDRSFRISISKASAYKPEINNDRCTEPFISVLTYWPLSNNVACLPKDFSFAVIDLQGKVLMHSDSSRNLTEDFFEASGNPGWLKEEMTVDTKEGKVHEMMYNGNKTYAAITALDVYKNANPLFLVTLKNRAFPEHVLIYAVIITLIITFGYNVLIIIASYLLSAVYYVRHVRMISFFHFNWMFPDESNRQKYRRLAALNAAFVAAMVYFSFYHDYSNVLILSISLSFILVFLHFTILIKKYSWSFRERAYLALTLLAMALVAIFPTQENYAIKIIAGIALATWCLRSIRLREIKRTRDEKDEKAGAKNLKELHARGSTRTLYNFFMTSILGLHYIFIPMLIFLSVIYCEKDRADFFISLSLKQQQALVPEAIRTNTLLAVAPLMDDEKIYYNTQQNKGVQSLLHTIRLTDLPSQYYVNRLEKKPIIKITANTHFASLSDRIGAAVNYKLLWILIMLAGITALFVLLYILLSGFSQRFFFFDLRESADYLYPYPSVAAHPRISSRPGITPLYKNLNQHEIYETENTASAANPALASILDVKGDRYPDYTWRLEMAVLLIRQQNQSLYAWEMKRLGVLERFVLIDLAKDNFVNYVNKDILISLIQKGFVVSDPVTGHIRVISKAFRLFLIEWEKENPTEFDQKKTETRNFSVGTLKLPVLIVIVATGIFLTYSDLDFNKSLLSFIGAFVTVLGLILRFTGDVAGKIK